MLAQIRMSDRLYVSATNSERPGGLEVEFGASEERAKAHMDATNSERPKGLEVEFGASVRSLTDKEDRNE